MRRVVVRAAAAVSSGLLLVGSFPPWEQGWLIWVALVPLFLLLAERNASLPLGKVGAWGAFGWGWVTGVVFFLVSLSWVITVSALGWVLFCFFLALYPAVWAAIVAIMLRHAHLKDAASVKGSSLVPLSRHPRVAALAGPYLRSRPNLLLALAASVMWVGLEWVRGWFLSGFGWNALGTALVLNLPMIQIAEFTGVAGISFVVAMVNFILAITLLRFAGEAAIGRIRAHYDFTLTFLLVVLVFLFGAQRLAQPEPPSRELRVSAVQPNIPLDVRRNPAAVEEIFATFRTLTQAAAATAPDLILWPESALPGGLMIHPENFEFTMAIMELGDFSLLTGTLDADAFGEYNAAALVPARSQGGNPQIYHKLHLVPFGEYVPFRSSFPLFAWVVGDQVPDDFDAGREPVVFKMGKPEVRLAPLICFEDTLGSLVRKFVLKNAEVLVNVTNDAWFLKSAASRQHLHNAIFRAVENRRPLLRAANTGVTAFIDSHGRIQNKLTGPDGDSFVEGCLFGVVRVPTEPQLTFFTKHGEVFATTCGFMILPLFGVALFRTRRSAAAPRPEEKPADQQEVPTKNDSVSGRVDS